MDQLENTTSLLNRLRDGDSDALSRLLQRNLLPLRKWAAGRVPQNARERFDTDDLIQESIIGLVPKLNEIEHRGPGAIQAYLRQAFMNRLRNEIKRTARRPPKVELAEEIPADGRNQLEELVDAESLNRYENCLAKLKHQDQAAVFMRLELGMNYGEIATELGKGSANTARMTVSRALVRLAELMNEARKVAAKHPESGASG